MVKCFQESEVLMSEKVKLVETGEKSRVVTFRLGESVYSALEKEAQATGGTVSATARKLILESLGNEEMAFKPGDTLRYSPLEGSSDFVVLLVNEPMTGEEVKKRVNKLVRGAQAKEGSSYEK